MNIVIRRVADGGVIDKERVVLHAESDDDIGRYILFESTYVTEGTISSNMRNMLWLPGILVNAGDLVVVYTKNGNNKSRTNSDGSKTHFIYWGLDNPVWNRDDACAVVLEISDWDMKKAR